MTTDAVGGVWQYSLDLANGLRRLGGEVVLAVLGPGPDPAQAGEARRSGIRLIETELPLDWTARDPKDVEEAGWAVARLALEVKPDLIHLNSPALAASAFYPAPVVAVCHSCVATWWEANRPGPLPPDFAWRTDLVRRGYLAVHARIAPSFAFAEATRRVYDLPEAPRVVPNGRRPLEIVPAAEPGAFVFTAGRLWDEGKNVAVLDRAAARLRVPVLAAGPSEGPNGARIALQHVQILGALDGLGMAEQLGKRPIFVSVARYEPFGLAVLEAAQAGCALVLSDIPTFREVWGGAAVFVPADDDEAVATEVERLLRDREARERLGKAAETRSRAFDVEAMSTRMLDVYRSVLAASASVEDAA
jgi:glycosyltransferase involved in cell wall biosynthesis